MLLPRGKYVARRKGVFCCCGLLYHKRTTFASNLTHLRMKWLNCFILYHLGTGGPSEGSSCEITILIMESGFSLKFAFSTSFVVDSRTFEFAFRSMTDTFSQPSSQKPRLLSFTFPAWRVQNTWGNYINCPYRLLMKPLLYIRVVSIS